MRKPDKLFELIKSMSMSEKRYFKLYVNRQKGENVHNYLMLFDLMEGLAVYDEGILVMQLKKDDLPYKYLAADKNYLYQILLKSLRSFHSGKSASLKVKEYLEYLEILYYKGLYSQCSKLLSKAQKIAEEFELHSLLVEILSWERLLATISGKRSKIEASTKELNINLNLISNRVAFNELYYKAFLLKVAYNKAREQKHIDGFKKLLETPLLQNEDMALSNATRIKYCEIWALYYFITDQTELEYSYNLKIMDLMNAIPQFMEEWPIIYTSIYSRILALQIKLYPKECKTNLEAFRAIPGQVKKAKLEVEVLVFVLSSGVEMSILIQELKYEQAISKIKSIEKGFRKYKKRIKPRFILAAYYRFAYVSFCAGKMKEALSYINIINNEIEESVRPDVFLSTKILNLIVHYELGNFNLLKYLIKSTQGFLLRRNRLYKTEKLLLNFFKKAAQEENSKTHTALFKALKKELICIWENELERKVLHYFDYENWVESKIVGEDLWSLQKKRAAFTTLP